MGTEKQNGSTDKSSEVNFGALVYSGGQAGRPSGSPVSSRHNLFILLHSLPGRYQTNQAEREQRVGGGFRDGDC